MIAAHADFIRTYLARPPQTNEVGRAAALLGGFLTIAETTRRPMRLLEIGSSAGLNLFWDRFSYRAPLFTWGNTDAPVKLAFDWEGPPPPLTAPVQIAARAGCDSAPVDIRDASNVRLLESYVWTDQVPRMERLRGAVKMAIEGQVKVDKASADDWLMAQLQQPSPGLATVIFHSVVWQYMSPVMQTRAEAAIAAAGGRATADSPVAWLRMEEWNPDMSFNVILTQWPGGVTRTLAQVQFHGAWVKWRG
jgi:hypothetical protein